MSCGCKSKNFADFQGAEYSPINNEILYGINKNMKALGVSDGTCNQIDPQIYTDEYKCGLGVAGGNPCSDNNVINNFNYVENPNDMETFENTGKNKNNNGYNFTDIINTIIIILIIYLIYQIYME